MDKQYINSNCHSVWAHRCPTTHWSFGASRMVPSIYCGLTSGTQPNYTLSKSGFVLEHGARIQFEFHADATGDGQTLNVEGTGAKPLFAGGGKARAGANYRPKAKWLSTAFYDADLDGWLFRGSQPGVNQFNTGFVEAMPFEYIFDLCARVGAHPWICIPMYALDPITDYTTELATFGKNFIESNNLDWMVPRYEISNEVWNDLFRVTEYADEKEFARGYPTFSRHNWMGRVASAVGQAISAVYDDDRTKYQVIVGHQMDGGTSNLGIRLNSPNLVAETGNAADAAKNWVTHVAVADYIDPPALDAEDVAEWNDPETTEERKAELLANYVAAGTWDESVTKVQNFVSYLNTNFPGITLNYYEGGFNATFLSGTTEEKAFKRAATMSPEVNEQTRAFWAEQRRAGSEFPSLFALSGGAQWAIFYPTQFDEPDQRWNALQDDIAGKRKWKFTLT